MVFSDNALEFVSAILNGICSLYKIKKTTIVSYHPNANGLAESAVRRVLNILRKLLDSKQNNWDELCPMIQAALNTSFHPSVGDNPHFLVFLKDHRHPFEEQKMVQQRASREEFVATHMELRLKINQVVAENLRKEAERFTMRYNKLTEVAPLLPGNRVYIKRRNFGNVPKRKLAELYQGPYRIMESLQGSKFKLQHLEKDGEVVVHADNIKKVREPLVGKKKPVQKSNDTKTNFEINIPQAVETPAVTKNEPRSPSIRGTSTEQDTASTPAVRENNRPQRAPAASGSNISEHPRKDRYLLRPRKVVNYKET